jgi:predicted enzyme related to lactoylglutathione lyase
MAKMNSVVHFEMPAKDKKRVSDFYSKTFGWQMNQLGPEMGNYVLAGTTETDENQMPKQPGAINGGFFEYQDKEGFNMPHLVISVDNLEESMKKVEEAGGKIIGGASGAGKIDDIPGIGRYISFEDSEGNHVGMLQPKN